jgi:hypothetical protein
LRSSVSGWIRPYLYEELAAYWRADCGQIADDRAGCSLEILFIVLADPPLEVTHRVGGRHPSAGTNPQVNAEYRQLAGLRDVDGLNGIFDRERDIEHPIGIDHRTKRDTPLGEE